MNKNVMHDGKQFAKGAEVEAAHPLVAQGHADEFVFKGETVDAAPEAPSFAEAEAEAVEKHSKKHGRK